MKQVDMSLSELLHQILYHADKIFTKQRFLTEGVSPDFFHQLFMLFVFWWWVGNWVPLLSAEAGAHTSSVSNESKNLPYTSAQKHRRHPRFRPPSSWGLVGISIPA